MMGTVGNNMGCHLAMRNTKTLNDKQCNDTHDTPVSGVLKVSTAGGLVPYSFMACADQLYCVLCWRLVRGREVAITSEKVVPLRVTV